MRDFLKGLDLDKETVDSIMAEYGKNIQGLKEEKDTLSQKVTTYESEIKNLKESSKDNDDWKTKFEDLDKKIKEQEAEAKIKAEDEILTNNILSVFGEKKFTSDYAKNGLIADIKSELVKPENKGKGISEIFASLTKNKSGIFEGSQMVDMPPIGDSDSGPVDLNTMSFDQYKAWRKNN